RKKKAPCKRVNIIYCFLL
ncbi:hypothetical protein CGH41_23795, partial [Vibrio parahaemolyticus]